MPQGSSAVRPTNGLYLLPFNRHTIVSGEGQFVLVLPMKDT